MYHIHVWFFLATAIIRNGNYFTRYYPLFGELNKKITVLYLKQRTFMRSTRRTLLYCENVQDCMMDIEKIVMEE